MVQKGKEFTDRETGVVTPAKFTHYFQVENDDGSPEVVTLRSKNDYSALVDTDCFGSVELYPMKEGSGFWASLTSCKDIRQGHGVDIQA